MNRLFRRGLLVSLASLLTGAQLVVAPPARAGVDRTWSGASSGDWSDGANWVGGVPPSPTDQVVFPPLAQRKAATNDIGGLALNGITLSGSGYTLNGLPVNLTGNISSSQLSGGNSLGLPVNFATDSGHIIDVADQAAELVDTGGFLGTNVSLTKTGNGLLSLRGGAPSGVVFLNAGILSVDSLIPTNVLASGGILTGSGAAGSTTANPTAIVAPGVLGGSGTLTLANPTLNGGSALAVLLTGSGNGRLVANADLTLTGNPGLILGRTTGTTAGTVFTLATVPGTTTGTFAGLPQGAVLALGSQQFQVSYVGGAGHDVTVTAVNTPSPNERFVDAVYLDLLGRFVDASSLGVWSSLLAQGFPRAYVAALVNTSSEYRQALVSTLYRTLLRRDPDPDGLRGFVAFLNAGARDEDAIAALVSSAEYFANVGDGANDLFLGALYLDLLGRSPDPGGFTHFLGLLNGGTPRAVVASALLRSTEFRGGVVDRLFVALLHRFADSGGRSFFLALLESGATQETVINHIVGSAEYFNRTQSSLVPSAAGANAPTTRAARALIAPIADGHVADWLWTGTNARQGMPRRAGQGADARGPTR